MHSAVPLSFALCRAVSLSFSFIVWLFNYRHSNRVDVAAAECNWSLVSRMREYEKRTTQPSETWLSRVIDARRHCGHRYGNNNTAELLLYVTQCKIDLCSAVKSFAGHRGAFNIIFMLLLSLLIVFYAPKVVNIQTAVYIEIIVILSHFMIFFILVLSLIINKSHQQWSSNAC